MRKEELIEQASQCEQVLTYGVDAQKSQLDYPAINEGNHAKISYEEFFEKLYVHIDGLEEQLISKLSVPGLFDLTSSVGIGKTTLLHYVLMQLRKRQNPPYVLIDFKLVHFRNKEDSFAKYLSSAALMQWQEWVGNLPVSESVQPLKATTYSAIDITAELVDAKFNNLVSPQVQTELKTLLNKFNDEKNEDKNFREWVLRLRDESVEEFAEVLSQLKVIKNNLTIKDLALGINELQKRVGKHFTYPIIALDNIDAIPDISTQTEVSNWLDTERGELGSLASVIYCKRITTDFVPSGTYEGRGGFYIGNITYNAQVRKREKSDFSQEYIKPSDLERFGSPYLPETKWDFEIFDKRIKFLEGVMANDNSNTRVNVFSCLTTAIKEILSLHPVQSDLIRQSGRNRRLMLGSLMRFIEYISKELAVDFDNVGKRDDGSQKALSADQQAMVRGSAIKSIYYKLLGSDTDRQNSIFNIPDDLLCPFSWVSDSSWGERQLSDGVIDAARVKSLPFYLLCAIGLIASDHRTALQTIAERLNEFDFRDEAIRNAMLTFLTHSSSDESPLFEIEGFFSLRSKPEGLNNKRMVLSTVRGEQICFKSIYLFNYLCERLKAYDKSLFIFKDESTSFSRGIVSKDIVRRFPYWIARLITLEMRTIDMYKGVGGAGNSILGYTKIITGDEGATVNSTISERCLESANRYLSFYLSKVILASERDLYDTYTEVKGEVLLMQKCIRHMYLRVSRGEQHGIPRDRIFDASDYARLYNPK
jgi:hypothetical protein